MVLALERSVSEAVRRVCLHVSAAEVETVNVEAPPAGCDTGRDSFAPRGDCQARRTFRHTQRPRFRVSGAREATADSDLDLLVDVDRGHGYLDMAWFALGVEDELGVFTQVATPGGLKLRIRDRVLREAVAL
jgi:predicted nucleotidyltransferase